ncbi:MAG: hypothetical protein EPN38_08170 [Rhodanobacteraceae bacterium]|nr:MAG: hypothetical protein EPN38_08170 [Rhodanobacteraceae bacterium]
MFSRPYLTVTAGFGLRSLSLSVLVVLLARAFGPSEFGGYAVSVSLASFIATFNGLGAGPLHVRDVAQGRRTYPESRDLVARRVLVWLLPLAIIALACGWFLVPHNVNPAAVALIVLGELLYYVATDLAMRVMQARERYARMTIALSAPSMLRVLIAIPLLLTHTLNLAAWALVSTGTGAAFCCIVFGAWAWRTRTNSHTHTPLFQESVSGLGFAVANASSRIHGDADKVILARMVSTSMAGVYTPAYRLVEVFLLPISAGVEWLLPSLFRQGRQGFGRSLRSSIGKIALTLLYASALCVGVYAASFVLPLLLGRAYAETVPIAHALALMPLTMTCWVIVRTLAATSGHERSAGVVELVGAVFNIVVTIALVAAWSWRGAVAATYLTQLAMVAGYILYIAWRSHRHDASKTKDPA